MYHCHTDHFDPQHEMIDIALSYSMNAEKVMTIMHPILCLFATVDIAVMVVYISVNTIF